MRCDKSADVLPHPRNQVEEVEGGGVLGNHTFVVRPDLTQLGLFSVAH